MARKSGQSNAERRRHARHSKNVCAWLLFHRDSAAYATLAVDLGLEGAQFSTTRRVDVGEQVLVSLQADPTGIECKGKICWCDVSPQGLRKFGVRFLDLTDDDRDDLARLLQDRQNSAFAEHAYAAWS